MVRLIASPCHLVQFEGTSNCHPWPPYRYFDAVDICKYRPDWMETRLAGFLPYPGATQLKVAKVTVFSHTEVELGLFQSGARLVSFCSTVKPL